MRHVKHSQGNKTARVCSSKLYSLRLLGANALLWVYRAPALPDRLTPSSNISPADYTFSWLCKDLLEPLTDRLFYSELKKIEESQLSLCCGFSSPLLTLGVYSGVIYLDCWWTELGLCCARRTGMREDIWGRFCAQKKIFLSCIFRIWTWASLNFGELNLYLPPPLKTHARGWRRYFSVSRRYDVFFFMRSVFCVSGLCIVLPVFVHGRVTCLFCFLFFFFCECIILW